MSASSDVDALRQALERDEPPALSQQFRLIRAAMRSDPAAASRLMQQAYVRGLEGAYAAGDEAGLASLASLGAVVLDSVGDYPGAIARLDQALTLASEDGEARPRIFATRAIYEAVGEQLSKARASLASAADALPTAVSMETRLDVEMCTAMVSCIALDLGELPQAASTIADAQAERLDSIASGLMVYLIATLAAAGESSEARAWADALQGYAGAVQHPARSVDALVAQFALKTRRTLEIEENGPAPQDIDERAGSTFNNAALWRTRVLVAYSALMRGDRIAARDAVDRLDRRRSVMHPAFQSASDGFSLAVRAMLEPGVSIESAPPPDQATLLSISGALA